MHTAQPHVHLYFIYNDTATTEIYTLSLHDALPILASRALAILHASIYDAVNGIDRRHEVYFVESAVAASASRKARSEEHTSELQSLRHLVCRLLLEKKK